MGNKVFFLLLGEKRLYLYGLYTSLLVCFVTFIFKFCILHLAKYIAVVGEPKSRILQNDKKIAPDFDTVEFLYTDSLYSARYGTTV